MEITHGIRNFDVKSEVSYFSCTDLHYKSKNRAKNLIITMLQNTNKCIIAWKENICLYVLKILNYKYI